MEKEKARGSRKGQDLYLDYACSLTLRRVREKERGRTEKKGRRKEN